MIYAVVTSSVKQTPGNTDIKTELFSVEVENELEAEGKAYRILRKMYPNYTHWIHVNKIENLIDKPIKDKFYAEGKEYIL